MAMPLDADAGEKIPTVLRTLLVLEELARSGAPVTPTEVNQALGLPKPTIHRLFATLEAEGFIVRELDGRSYAPGGRLRRMSVNVMSSQRVRMARMAVLNALADDVGETCNLAIPDRDTMIYLERVETKWPLRIQLPVGTHVPLHCTASGKMYLSTLPPTSLQRYVHAARLQPQTARSLTDPDALLREVERIRTRGFSEDNGEFMDGMIALAMPILDNQDRLLATVSFHAPEVRLTLDRARGHLGRLRTAATELSALASG
ncbi:MAG: IclR family transcriptional regulator [Pseudomonadota bacterium]